MSRTCLEQVCPKDVRKPLPKAIDAQAFNILTCQEDIIPVPKSGCTGYYRCIKNLQYIPLTENNRLPTIYRPSEKQIVVEHLAFIRHAIWRLNQGWPYTEYLLPLRTIWFSCRGKLDITIPTQECANYINHQVRTLTGVRYNQDLEHRLVLLCMLWAEDVIESVESMVLRKRLAEGWRRAKLVQFEEPLARPSQTTPRRGVVRRTARRVLGWF